MNPASRQCCWGLLARRECWRLTWRGRAAAVLLAAGFLLLAVHGAYPFLAANDPIPGGALVVEGWAGDYGMQEAIAEFKRRPYTKLYVTGGPLEHGAPLSEFHTTAELGVAILLRLGMQPDAVQAVPGPLTRKDRTYASALALRNWLREHRVTVPSVTVMSVGPHARRTRLLFEEALGPNLRVGIIALPDQNYGPHNWWKCSLGFRSVTDEAIAYAYARLLFRPSKSEADRSPP